MQCSADVHVLVAGSRCDAVAAAAANIQGVTRVLMADGVQFADGLPENVAQQVHALGLTGSYTHIVAAATSYGKSILPRAAARLNVGQISEVTKVLSPDTFERPIYAGNAIATVQALGAIKVLTIRAVSFEPATSGGAAQVHQVATAADSGRSVFVSREQAINARPELTSAPIVVAGGRGLGSSEQFKILEPLADRLGAALGASRAAVDAGFAANDLQVGQTGKVVAPGLYIAIGISGAIQHLAGMTDSKVIVAINKDPEAPIFSVADYGIVGDLFEVVPQLMQALEEESACADLAH
ncbi:MAG: FAD-binding protein [Oxalicibacterium faecigallinarum]|uniref:electron transfer flavoprotein subunit alpha/FixB family protein n=1 Tax=Oxalicibacterium faecigallinarum TaxID=573741 RepID=UPI002806E90C|nr:FAD-binding protein [Oxalicibacterium faecigallinarum]MDQ7970862.1 FAD-binding protein [Oxalicibacterium faecigallinarum]